MDLRAGSFITQASDKLKLYKEFEAETADYVLKRTIVGTRVFLEVVIKSNASSFMGLELIPPGFFKHFFYGKMVLTTQNIDGVSQSGDSGTVTFNKLVTENTQEKVALIDANDEYDYEWSNSLDSGVRDPDSPRVGDHALPIIRESGLKLDYTAELAPLVGRVNIISLEATVTGIYDA